MEENLLTDPCVAFPAASPARVVSLVPSMTGSMADLGLEEALVGISDYCFLPAGARSQPERVGGPKDASLEKILRLRPDLVLANREENSRELVEGLARAGVLVWITFPITVRAALDDLWTLTNLFRSPMALERVQMLERAVEWAEQAAGDQPPVRYFCPIWESSLENGERWWMTFNDQTYSHDVLRLFNGENVFAGRERHYPLLADLNKAPAEEAGERDTRYPRLGQEEIIAAQPSLILLPSEPYAYNQENRETFASLFAGTPAGRDGNVFTVDGSLLTWPGTRLGQALELLPAYFRV